MRRRYAASDNWHVPVVQPIDQHDQPQRLGLVVQGADLLQAHQGNAVHEGPVLRRVHLGQEPDQVQEVVQGGAFGVLGGVAHLFVGAGFGCFGGAAVSIVLTIDAQYVEVCGQSLDLAQVFGSEASFTEFSGSVLEVAARYSPESTRSPRRVDFNTVSPGASSANASIQTRRLFFNTSTARRKPSKPTRLVYSTKVP